MVIAPGQRHQRAPSVPRRSVRLLRLWRKRTKHGHPGDCYRGAHHATEAPSTRRPARVRL